MFLYPVFLINLCVLNKIFFLTHKSHKDLTKKYTLEHIRRKSKIFNN